MPVTPIADSFERTRRRLKPVSDCEVHLSAHLKRVSYFARSSQLMVKLVAVFDLDLDLEREPSYSGICTMSVDLHDSRLLVAG